MSVQVIEDAAASFGYACCALVIGLGLFAGGVTICDALRGRLRFRPPVD